MMDGSMIERVAEAIDAAFRNDDDSHTAMRRMARAAIEAMREPTEAMFEAFGADIDWEVFPGYWARAIDAAKGDE